MFLANCPHHVSVESPTIWGAMPVSEPSTSPTDSELTYKQALSNWLKDTKPFQVVDSAGVRNPACPACLPYDCNN